MEGFPDWLSGMFGMGSGNAQNAMNSVMGSGSPGMWQPKPMAPAPSQYPAMPPAASLLGGPSAGAGNATNGLMGQAQKLMQMGQQQGTQQPPWLLPPGPRAM